jgi:predicted HAD superfamily Cof-like phosphohydrolase
VSNSESNSEVVVTQEPFVPDTPWVDEIKRSIATQRPVHQHRVDQFMRKANQAVPDVPTVPDEKTLKLRARIIFEEFKELLEAMGVDIFIDTEGRQDIPLSVAQEEVVRIQEDDVDMVGVTDALADLSVVLYGTASAFGISMAAVLDEVDRNNLAKFGPGHYVREDGKLVKPPNHVPPDFEKVLIAQGWVRPESENGHAADTDLPSA